jgi:alpha-L-arabinofuranosidase
MVLAMALLLTLAASVSILMPPNRHGRTSICALMLCASWLLHGQQSSMIVVEDRTLHGGVKRLGINLGASTSFDSRMILRNLITHNPGFEGEEWQSILECATVMVDSCTDASSSGSWPEGFFDGASYEVLTGAARGQRGTILHSSAVSAATKTGVTVSFAQRTLLSPHTFIVVRKHSLGGATVGWSENVAGGGLIAAETIDLSPHTAGRQAVRLSSPVMGHAMLSQYFDSTVGRIFVRMNGSYVLRFRARGVSGSRQLSVQLKRLTPGHVTAPLLSKTVLLGSAWDDYELRITAHEEVLPGTVALSFTVSGAEVLLDDVSLTPAHENGTAFRDEVVEALQRLHPGVLRYMDSGQNFGSSIDNLLTTEGARQRTGYNRYMVDAQETPIGLADFLTLAEKLGAEPWFTMPLGMSPEEGKNLLEYLGGDATKTRYGAIRAHLGHAQPWTQVFPVIHLEYGNEAWNRVQAGASIPDPEAYADRATQIFAALRSSSYFFPENYDLIADAQAVSPYWTKKLLAEGKGFDTIDIAPYLYGPMNDDSSLEHIFGPMLAEPEMLDTAGYVHQQAESVAHAGRPMKLAVYETNIGTVDGTVSQESINLAVPSLGAGLAAIDHMLLMLREDGIIIQNTFALGGDHYRFNNTRTHDSHETSPVWGVVVDMGGGSNQVRPSFLAQELANQAIRSTMLATHIQGDDPRWDQALSSNGNIAFPGAHELQSYAFTDGKTDTLILFNLSRTTERSVRLAGAHAPQGVVIVKTLTAKHITDNNEADEQVKIAMREEKGVTPAKSIFALPPFSMTVLMTQRRIEN